MKVTQEKLPASQLGLEIEVPAGKSKEIYENVVQNLARSLNLPGFRKGKIPRHILIQRLGQKAVLASALEKLLETTLREAIKQEEINSLGNLQILSDFDALLGQYEPGQPLTYKASVDVPPSVVLGTYKGLTVQAEEAVFQPEDVEKALEAEREELATLVVVEDRPAQEGDTAIVDYSARFVDEQGEETGDPIPGTVAQDTSMELKPELFIPGMVEGVVGMAIGDTKKIPLTFPEQYHSEDLAGKAVVFTVTIKELKTPELPALDDAFAQEVSEFATLGEYRESLEKNLRQEAADRTKNSSQQAILKAVIATTPVALPATMVEQEVQAMLTETAIQLSQYGLDVKQFFTQEVIANMRERARPDAEQRLTNTLVLQTLAQEVDVQVSEETIAERLATVLKDMGSEEVDQDRLKRAVTEELTVEAALQWLQENNTVELVAEGTLSQEDETAEATEA